MKAEQFLESCRIKKDTDAMKLKLRDLDSEYVKKRKDLEALLNRQQSLCPHLFTDYHADPAGGTDSTTTCAVCGKEW